MTPFSLMTAHEIILSMGYCCSSLTMVFFTLVVMMMYPAVVPWLVCAHGVYLTAAYLVYVQGKYGWTPLMSAANNGHARCIQLLVEYVPKVM